eukprot:5458864-Prymnesium_polylepis.1
MAMQKQNIARRLRENRFRTTQPFCGFIPRHAHGHAVETGARKRHADACLQITFWSTSSQSSPLSPRDAVTSAASFAPDGSRQRSSQNRRRRPLPRWHATTRRRAAPRHRALL